MNYIEIALSFLEGLGLITSPCILPILPLVLGASIDGGKKRPLGVIVGFVISFTTFAFLSRQIINDLNAVKIVSLILLGIFGVILISEKLSNFFAKFSGGIADFGNRLSIKAKEGFFGGVFIGILIGFVWTPCAGPILATALVQIIRQESDVAALFMIGAFSLGAAVPMFIIAVAGRRVLGGVRFLTKNSHAIRKIFGVIILASVFFVALSVNASAVISGNEKVNYNNSNNALIGGLAETYVSPEISGVESWLNSQPLKISDLRGKVVLIDFWTYSCINCVRTLPYITKWDEKYRDKGLVIIGVHSPEFEFEKNINNVKNALREHNIQYPVALDNKFDTWMAFQNRYWPAHYLIDQNGKVVYTHFGEGNYETTENNIRYLLGIKNKAVEEDLESSFSRDQTPETYLGYSRTEEFYSPQRNINKPTQYTFPKELPLNGWALSGMWKIEKDKISSAQKKMQNYD